MSFTRPTLPELVDRIQADFVSRLSLVGAVLRRSNVYVMSRVLAGAAHMLHGHLEFLSRQQFADQSDDAYLIRQASVFGMSKNPATFATATTTATGTNGVVIPALAILQRSDGAEYQTTAPVTIASGTATLPVSALVAGAVGTLTAGVVLNFESPITNVAAATTVTGSTADGSDQETTSGLRARFLARLSAQAQGGSDADYVDWAKSVTGVTRVWVSDQEMGPGTVVVRFARDNDVSPIPDSGEVTTVQAVLNTNKPAHATVFAVAPAASVQAFTMHIVPDTGALRTAVTAELADLILRTSAPGATLLLSSIRTAIGGTAGITDYTLASPAADVTHTVNQLATMGTVTFT